MPAAMDLFQVDDDGQLFISAAIEEWDSVARFEIDTVIDLDGGLDACIPTCADQCLYVYFPICDDDERLPSLTKLRALGQFGAALIRSGHRVLAHCGMGYNRSALVAGLILIELGMPGRAAVARCRERRPGALYNPMFAAFLESLEPGAAQG
jgi:hypothetical protein